MKEVFVPALIAIVLIQAVVIVTLVRIVNNTRHDKKQQGKECRKFVKSVIRSSIAYYELAEDYKDAYELCYAEYKAKFRAYRDLKREYQKLEARYDALEETHSMMCGNLFEMIREGRVIKSKYGNKVFTYDFPNITKAEITQLFGKLS